MPKARPPLSKRRSCRSLTKRARRIKEAKALNLELIKINSKIENNEPIIGPIKNVICRVCMSESNNTRPIFALENFSGALLPINEVIATCASVQIQLNDGLPQHICMDCLNDSHRAFAFKKRCEDSDNKLRRKCIETKVIDECDHFETSDKEIQYNMLHEKRATPEKQNYEIDMETGDLICLKLDAESTTITNLSEESENHDDDVYCIIEPEFVDMNIIKIDRNTLNEQRNICSKCKRLFETEDSMAKHMVICGSENIHKCNSCGLEFAQKFDLGRHIRKHCYKDATQLLKIELTE